MPGLNLVFAFEGQVKNRRSDYQAALEKTLFEKSHSTNVLFEDEQLLSSITSHDSYPVRTFENNGTKYCIEGKIYNFSEDQVNDAMIAIVERLLKNDATARTDLKDWLLSADGEFIIFAYNKTANRVILINDIFGLLPCYIHKTDWGIVFSRNFSFVAAMVQQKVLDKMAIAQFLIFRHTISKRTYLKDVYRSKPAEIIMIDTNSGDIQREVLYVFNFDEKKYSNRSTKTNAAEITKLFIEGCRNRVRSDCKTIVSLSGGLDSRSIATALKGIGIDFEARTFLDVNKTAAVDLEMAQRVAGELEVDWKPLELKPLLGRNMLRVLRMRSGLVYIGKVFIFQLFDKIVSDYGSKVTVFVGLGGDRIGHDITTTGPKKITKLSDVLNRYTTFMLFETVAKLTGVSEEEFFEEIKKELASYPEKNMTQKLVHLAFYGQTFNWHFEGHDRMRSFFWPASPFFSTPFFKYIMNCPDKQKTFLRLYYYFLNNLNPAISKIPCARNQFSTPIDLPKARLLSWYWYCRFRQMCHRIRSWPNPIRFVIKKIKKLTQKPTETKKGFKYAANLIKCMTEQVSNCRQIQDCLNWSVVEEMIEKCEYYESESFFNLLTMVSMVEDLITGQSTLEKYQESNFGSFDSIIYDEDPTQNF